MATVAASRPHVQSEAAAPARKSRNIKPAHGVARLVLSINGTSYAVKPVACDAYAAVRAFRLRKSDGTCYDVAETVHGHTCDCPDWEFNREGRDPAGCKHIKSMVAVGLLPLAAGARTTPEPTAPTGPLAAEGGAR